VAAIELRVLGGFEARVSATGGLIQLPTRKCEAVLAYASLDPGRLIRRELLVSLLWADVPRAQGRHSLRQTLTKIRRALAPCGTGGLVTISDSIRVAHDCVSVDALQFQRLLLEPSPDAVRRAIELYRGPFLDGFAIPEEAFEEWMTNERTRLRQLAIDACAAELETLEKANAIPAAIRVANKLLELEPLHEDVHRQLMVLYWRNGQIRSALNQYEVCARRMKQAFGVEPSAQTVALYREWLLKYNRMDPPISSTGFGTDRRDVSPHK
jgi:DNA-binding SARP family transcriptional activator